ncbi:MAG: GNAT family N-acetyltransferase [Candidatus Marinimicrobia bacterium]|nr:GNAT family N-acetyltransferase [Candidatus Neomarinimicrobiota bacterium]
MSMEILTTDDAERWWHYFEKLPETHQHIHFTPDYHRVLESNGDGKARLFVHCQGANLFFYPFMLRKIDRIGEQKVDQNYHDVSSVFGYTGPLIFSDSKGFLNLAQEGLGEIYSEQKVISEIIRYNPILENDDYTADGIQNVPVKEYVYIDFPDKPAELSAIYSSRLKTYLNKAQRKDFDVNITSSKKEIYDFFELYYQHMQEMDVDNYYLFSDKYFKRLYQLIQQYGYLVYSRKEGKLAAGLIFLEYKNTAYYHHGARNIDVNNSGLVNKYLFHRAFLKQMKDGLSNCLLGGGVTRDKDDSLLQFKKFFTNKSYDFVIGKRIVDQKIYNRVVEIWKSEYPSLAGKYRGYVDKYRFCE